MDAKTPSQYRRSLLPFYAIAILGACQQLMGADEASSTAGRVTPLSLPAGTVLLGLSEVSPGTFVSLPGAEAYLFTSQGKLTPFCQTPATLGPDSVWVLAGRQRAAVRHRRDLSERQAGWNELQLRP